MYIEEDYPTKDGEIKHVTSYTTNNLNLICEKRSSMPVFIIKCGDKYYHKVDLVKFGNISFITVRQFRVYKVSFRPNIIINNIL